MKNGIKLGDTVSDAISGFAGVVTAMTFHLGGLITCRVEARSLTLGAKDFDHRRLNVIGDQASVSLDGAQ